jgi:transposase
MKKNQRSKRKKKLVVSGGRVVEARSSEELNRINEHAAGIDVGGERHYVAVPPGSSEHPVREFGVFTKDLYAIAEWLRACGVETVAMESAGVYWVPLYEVLEERGLKVKLVDARKVKNVSGRKTDVLDCQWVEQLESYGLLQAAYRPADEIVVLRSYVRQRERKGEVKERVLRKFAEEVYLNL